ncbi:MAG: LLM class flavin-dependent oxidoreductase [Myxococcota bacterium]|jgi:alkanesulfonate monooxygenase SsuD/methylene tetrahydromethanopterin reductase-like flavin-dependent oxidoreductase (luciferase family)|nr:LLM class flavin-dependent oxidoreductase [Myxococcota bacterium]
MEFWTTSIGLSKMRPMPSSLADGFANFIEGAKKAEALGFDGYGSGEHHFMYDEFIPIPLQAMAAAAAVTERVRLSTNAMLLPLYDPMEAAEIAATLDVLSDGRVSLGLGMGYRPYEFDAFGTAKRTRGARLREAMEVLRLATSQDTFSYQGKHYQYENESLHPRPIQRPIDMWFCGGTSLQGARRAGAAGLGYWLANCPFDHTEAIVKEYRQAGKEAGFKESELRIASFKDICIGNTMEEAEGLRKVLMDNFYDEHILGYGYLVDENGKNVYNPSRDHPLYERFIQSLYCGTIEMVVEELEKYEELGMEMMFFPSAQSELISEQILPEFK